MAEFDVPRPALAPHEDRGLGSRGILQMKGYRDIWEGSFQGVPGAYTRSHCAACYVGNSSLLGRGGSLKMMDPFLRTERVPR